MNKFSTKNGLHIFLIDLKEADIAIRNAYKTKNDIDVNVNELDPEKLLILSNTLHEAESTSKLKSRSILNSHFIDFPLSPIFSDCTLLSPLGMDRKETAITSALAWLLSPRETHGLGDLLLCAFINALPNTAKKMMLLESIKDSHIDVYSEYQIKNTGRIDILIEGNSWVIIIEAKVDAAEGNNQTTRYKQWFDKQTKVPTYIYLTTDGKSSGTEEYETISYFQIAKQFIKHLKDSTNKPGFNFAQLFVAGLLREFCDIKPSKNIDKIINSNSFKLELLLNTGNTN